MERVGEEKNLVKNNMKTYIKGGIKTTGSFKGQSNKLGFGGRAAQLKAKGVPGGVSQPEESIKFL